MFKNNFRIKCIKYIFSGIGYQCASIEHTNNIYAHRTSHFSIDLKLSFRMKVAIILLFAALTIVGKFKFDNLDRIFLSKEKFDG